MLFSTFPPSIAGKDMGGFISLEDTSWEDISKIAKEGKAAERILVGSIKSLTYSGNTYRMRVVGVNHDIVTDPESYGGFKAEDGTTRAGVTFESIENIYGTTRFGPTVSSYANVVYWGDWTDGTTKGSRLQESTIRSETFSDTNFVAKLDSGALTNLIVPVQKKYYVGYLSAMAEVSDKVFLLSAREIGIASSSADYYGEGETYAYYDSLPRVFDKIRTSVANTDGAPAANTWLRTQAYDSSASAGTNKIFTLTSTGGRAAMSCAGTTISMGFAFCL